MIKRWKEEGKNLLILDGGDLFYPKGLNPSSQNEKAVLNLKAKAIVAAFNQMGCNAITIGEDDLLWGKENLLEIMKDAEFPAVSANLIDGASGEPLFQPYVIEQMEGFSVGIFGLFPEVRGSKEGSFAGLTVLDPFKTAQQVVSEVQKKADVVVLLSHLGYAKDLELAKKVEGIHVIVGGHSGVNLSYPRIIRNTVVLQVSNRGRYLGRVDLRIDDLSRPFVNVATRDMLEKRLQRIEAELEILDRTGGQDSAQKERKRETLGKQKAEGERTLGLYEGHNELANQIVSLTQEIPQDANCEGVLKPYFLQISELERASPSGSE